MVATARVFLASLAAVKEIFCSPIFLMIPRPPKSPLFPYTTLLRPSLTVTPLKTLGTAAWQLPSVLAFGSGEQFTAGADVSVTVKIGVQVAQLPAASVAVTVIVCAPRPTNVPAAGD